MTTKYLFLDIGAVLPDEIRKNTPPIPVRSDRISEIEIDGTIQLELLLIELFLYLEEYPEHISQYCDIGVSLTRIVAQSELENDQIKKALSHYQQAVVLAPDNCAVRCEYAAALRIDGQDDKALAEYEVFVTMADPEKWAQVFIDAARTYQYFGNHHRASELLAKVEPYCKNDQSFLVLQKSIRKKIGSDLAEAERVQRIPASFVCSLVRHLSLEMNVLGWSLVSLSGEKPKKEIAAAVSWWKDQKEVDLTLLTNLLKIISAPNTILKVHRFSKNGVEEVFNILVSEPDSETPVVILYDEGEIYRFERPGSRQEAISRIIGAPDDDPNVLATTALIIRTLNTEGSQQERQLFFIRYPGIVIMIDGKEQFGLVPIGILHTTLEQVLTMV